MRMGTLLWEAMLLENVHVRVHTVTVLNSDPMISFALYDPLQGPFDFRLKDLKRFLCAKI